MANSAGHAQNVLGAIADVLKDGTKLRKAVKLLQIGAAAFGVIGALGAFTAFFIPDET